MSEESLSPLFPEVVPIQSTEGDFDVTGMISRRAYELFEERGRVEGHGMEDWLKAEREIKHHLGLGN